MTASVTTYRMPVGIVAVAGGAWRNLRERFPELWPLLLPWSAAVALNGVLIQAVKAGGEQVPALLAHVGASLASGLTYGVLSGIALRILLGRGPAAWRLDRELGAYVTLTTAIQLASSVSDLAGGPSLTHPSPAEAAQHLQNSLVAAALSVVGLWLAARLILWPVAQLMGERRASAIDSFRRMNGAVWTYWLAGMLAAAPLFIPGALLDWPYVRNGQVSGLILAAPFFAAAALVGAAVQAELFQARWLRD